MAVEEKVLGRFLGDESFPIEWASEDEKELLWIFDDLHVPQPVSPMFFDIGGWWLTCDHMFRRFATPFASDWIAKKINGYVYAAPVPADSRLRVDSTEYNARYGCRVPRDPAYAAKMGPYLNTVLPVYAQNFLTWWKQRFRPEMDRNFAYLDSYDHSTRSLGELAIHLEDAIDIHDRHWKIHWMLNFSQFSATMNLRGVIQKLRGTIDENLFGRLQSSVEDRNWDSIEALWTMKNRAAEIPALREAFTGDTARDVLLRLQRSDEGRRFITESLEPYQREFGNKSIWSHEFVFPTWKENPGPIIEAVRGYLQTDYDYPKTIEAVRKDLAQAVEQVKEGLRGEQLAELQAALDLALNMSPLTPDHHFYIDQGTNARLRLVLVGIGDRLVEDGVVDDREDVVFLLYNELRELLGNPSAFDARSLVSRRRDEREAAFEIRPRDWVGTATQELLDFPYNSLWGFPEKFNRQYAPAGEIRGLAASPGVVEGPARYVRTLEDFDEVRQGEVLVCQMTNPAWVVLFTKIVGLVTDAGGTASHPAVVSREFGIPAVVGTSVATQRIATGDRVRVNGSTGVVELLA
ncbi:MAG: PEP-utilizing enzyme [Candidatus Dormibacteraeota bacterium]|nr:PEP-utilizing enzyme [Candidatus Dormibacteraeota bacterium]